MHSTNRNKARGLLALYLSLVASATLLLSGCYNGFSDQPGSLWMTWYTPGVYKGAHDPLMDRQADPHQLQRLRERLASANRLAEVKLPTVNVKAADEPRSNPRADLWREVRRGNAGYTAVSGHEANVLIQGSGQIWREARNGPATIISAGLLGGVLLAVLLYFVIKGPVRLERSGRNLSRWSLIDRLTHWLLALTFLGLACTGLILLFGKHTLSPLLGKEAFAAWASASITVHNIVAPLFIVMLIVALVSWLKHNIPHTSDLRWMIDMLRGRHAPAGFANGGEKFWYWLLFLAGGAASISGLMLLTPGLDWPRAALQIANILHIASTASLMAFAVMHIYLGTVGIHGTFEAMTRGTVDERWAANHHSIWYTEVTGNKVEHH